MGVLGALFGGIYAASSGPKTPAAAKATPPINASSADEADFIKCAKFCSNMHSHPLRLWLADL